ncbi:alpha-L-fucosidase [Flammeovirga agarivorans]|uniref:alpha-L-fucosidase n=1 Tax=Flammeovirga agarivorans TaxID=2726742 RepID=A0A7X8XY38_9BACT|nr:alpha-L-fucosidase [Flammeovirga agarivorans]NLR93859.1 hypothetical protein [Flammeovirga agarivorans]
MNILKPILIFLLLVVTSKGYSQKKEKKTTNEQKEIADLAMKMEGGHNSGDLPWRLTLSNPLEMTENAQWFNNAGLGLFIHWGTAAGYYGSPWVMRRPKEKGSDQPMASYQEYYEKSIQRFTAENYDPSLWMNAAKKAGFKYVVLTAKHHDGYTLWPSKHTDLGVQKNLEGRDLLQPFVKAVKNEGLKLGFYFSGADWHLDKEYMSLMKYKGKVLNWKGEYVSEASIPPLPVKILKQKKKIAFELMKAYTPDIWWWDSGLPVNFKETALAYNPDMLFNNRGNVYHPDFEKGPYPGAHFVTPENFHMVKWEHMKKLKANGVKWEVCMSLNKGYGWFYEGKSNKSESIRNMGDILFAIARVRCWGGNVLLNIKPRPDGSLPDENYVMFSKMERWMKHSSQSIYEVEGTHFPEQSNVPITTSLDKKVWYVHARPGESKWQKGPFYEGCSPNQPIAIQNVPKVLSVTLLRTGAKVKYQYNDRELIIDNPPANKDGLHEVIKVVIDPKSVE